MSGFCLFIANALTNDYRDAVWHRSWMNNISFMGEKALRNEANSSFSVNYLLQLNAKLELVSTKLNKQI